ncbi:MAG: inorganic phosphate transporter [Luteolibacter sp.]
MSFVAEIASHPSFFLVVFAVGLALAFEFVNGFHDTANAVATVIYTNTLKPVQAVVWSGFFNFLGVLFSTGAVAYGIISLLPVELVLNAGSGTGFAMVLSLLLSAILWNVGTWYFGLPASSSHTLIGSILGVGLANSYMAGQGLGDGVNWAKAKEVGLSLMISPVVGFVLAALLLLLLKVLVRKKELFEEPDKTKKPPIWVRVILMITCTGVSYAHGSNDGQKGMGLIMLILVGLLPGTFALQMSEPSEGLAALAKQAQVAQTAFAKKAEGRQLDHEAARKELQQAAKPAGKVSADTFAALAGEAADLQTRLTSLKSFNELAEDQRRDLRTDLFLVSTVSAKAIKAGQFSDDADKKAVSSLKDHVDGVTKFIPTWVKVAVALALGLGTMIGWKRIVVTVGEKIGKSHLTYGQGAAAETVAMATIFAADTLGLPVSTTHILSSGIAGTMAANRSGLQAQTLRNILLAWVLTLPVCIFLGSIFFAFANYVVLHWFGMN